MGAEPTANDFRICCSNVQNRHQPLCLHCLLCQRARHRCTNGAVWVMACKHALKKHVLPRFCRPQPMGRPSALAGKVMSLGMLEVANSHCVGWAKSAEKAVGLRALAAEEEEEEAEVGCCLLSGLPAFCCFAFRCLSMTKSFGVALVLRG